MAKRDDIIKFLNTELKTAEIPDSSVNGLQVEGKSEVRKAVFGVSFSLQLARKAAEKKADILIVHHGFLWDKPVVLKGPAKEKIKILIESGITLLAYHLPLDAHPKLGHNAALMKMIGMAEFSPFGEYHGKKIGFCGKFSGKGKSRKNIVSLLKKKISAEPKVIPFGPPVIRKVAIVSGGADSMLSQAADAGMDLYITGEISEPVQETARENGINFIAAGHYNTEKPGLWELEKAIKKKFSIATEFIDIPNPV